MAVILLAYRHLGHPERPLGCDLIFANVVEATARPGGGAQWKKFLCCAINRSVLVPARPAGLRWRLPRQSHASGSRANPNEPETAGSFKHLDYRTFASPTAGVRQQLRPAISRAFKRHDG